MTSFVFIIRLTILELYNVMRDAVEKGNFEKQAILVTLSDSISHVHITCGQIDLIHYTAADYWQETHSYDCYGLPSTVIVFYTSIK